MYNIRHIEVIKKSLVVHSAKDGTEVNDYFKWVICSLYIFIEFGKNKINHQKAQKIFRSGKNRICGRVLRSDALMTELLGAPHCIIAFSIRLGFFLGFFLSLSLFPQHSISIAASCIVIVWQFCYISITISFSHKNVPQNKDIWKQKDNKWPRTLRRIHLGMFACR